MSRKMLLSTIILLCSTQAYAELSANIGWQSEYIFRGIPQSSSSAQAGLDFENGGFYLGTWAADVGMGAEVDVYGGYGFEVEGFSFGIGGTGYYYTDEFDDTYTEINLSAGYGPVTLDYADGEYDNFAGPTQDYGFFSATLEHESGFYGVIGSFSKDADGNYYQIGWGTEIGDFDVAVDWIYSDEKILGPGAMSESNLVFSVGKSFTISE